MMKLQRDFPTATSSDHQKITTRRSLHLSTFHRVTTYNFFPQHSANMSKRTRSTKTPTKQAPAEAEITHSIIVPAYKEKANLRPLTTRLFAAFEDSDSPIPAESVEVIVVDDNSQDGSVEEVESLQGEGLNVRIVVRTSERGLSSAVVRGFREARGEAMICMDADLQHPPEAAPRMLSSITEKKPFVLGTRYGPGVEMDKDVYPYGGEC
jgi:cellulose synthase/poly-beta-1,6-N-acetylglucosamine synthase-like glycosyltransferase